MSCPERLPVVCLCSLYTHKYYGMQIKQSFTLNGRIAVSPLLPLHWDWERTTSGFVLGRGRGAYFEPQGVVDMCDCIWETGQVGEK